MKIMQLGAVGVLSLSLFSGTALAQSYISASLGSTSPNESEFKDDTGFRVTFGYLLTPRFSIEATYADLGSFDATASTVAQLNGLLDDELGSLVMLTGADVSVSGLEFSGNFFLPLNESFSLFARAGLFLWDAKYGFDIAGWGRESEKEDGNDIFFGVGAQYNLTETVSLKAEFNRYDVEDSDVDFLGVGLTIKF